MLRRSFRIGLLVGLLGGAVAAVLKALQGRAVSQPAGGPSPEWTPIPDAQPVVVPSPVVEVVAPRRPADRAVSIADLQEAPTPVKRKAAAVKKATSPPWVEPVDGECPPTHPVKGKLASKIYHLPGGFNYPRTKPDRCYRDAAAAEADGLRPAKR